MTVEKSRLLERVDTLEGGNDKFMELKENQVIFKIWIYFFVKMKNLNKVSQIFHLKVKFVKIKSVAKHEFFIFSFVN